MIEAAGPNRTAGFDPGGPTFLGAVKGRLWGKSRRSSAVATAAAQGATRGSSKKVTVFPAVVSSDLARVFPGVARSGKLQLRPCNCSAFRAVFAREFLIGGD